VAGAKPADDTAFRIYQGLHAYDKADLKAAVESADQVSPSWRSESFSVSSFAPDRAVVVRQGLAIHLAESAARSDETGRWRLRFDADVVVHGSADPLAHHMPDYSFRARSKPASAGLVGESSY
jgi:hypothetical protein